MNLATNLATNHAQLAQDYRRAAEIVRKQGLARQTYVSTAGTVCAAGALQIATGQTVLIRRHATLEEIKDGQARHSVNGLVWDYQRSGKTNHAETYERFYNAINHLSPMLPTTGCADECGLHHTSEYHVNLASAEPGSAHASERVFHFNDFICEGGEDLARIFDQAAEKHEAEL